MSYYPKALALLYWAPALGYIAVAPMRPFIGSGLLKAAPILLLLALCARQLQGQPRRLAMLALAFAACGDIILDLGHHTHLLPGLCAFAITQLAYIRLFAQRPEGEFAFLAWTLPLGTAAFIWLISPFLFDTPQGHMFWPMAIYAALLTAMVMTVMHGARDRSVIFGAMLFLVSDSWIAIDTFIWPSPWGLSGIWLSYYAAQWLLIQSLLQSESTLAKPAIAVE
ncbi:lysoplasmalogenase [Ferrimonas marina]|uniref:Uncharacterized membrane protein YhhN n=1 Tax=Ferrimonas marina TaxID=299255 RepID=A0A1M5YTT8_9GAMM|nr:lysoplasmalogenase [Ferrimonas marina]SHI15003.1 Uncharacterized membrane protein YhhN [Ferrimonas marina]